MTIEKIAKFLNEASNVPSKEVYKFLMNLDFVQKPETLSKVNGILDLSKAPEEVQNFIKKLPIHPKKDILDAGKLYKNFVNPISDQFVLFEAGSKEYLINTEGYDYPRYVIRIIR